MLKIGLINRISIRRRFTVSYFTTGKTPFNLSNTDGKDDKYKELNSMYVDMFTPEGDESETVSNPNNNKSELEEINEEMNDLCNIGYKKISSQDLQSITKSPGRFILQSLSHNPYYNLSLEDYIFRNTPSCTGSFTNQRLLFYINDNCAVMGKNQTSWKELHLKQLQESGYEILRRLSGGGAVIHDLGNVNYSFLTARDEFKTSYFNELITQWINRMSPMDYPLKLNKRGDITYNDKKCSGSAFKIAKGKAYHHGTMLISAQLDKFHGLLKPDHINGVEWECNSVDSVRSEITNIPFNAPGEFIDLCIKGFREEFALMTGANDSVPVYYCDETSTMNTQIAETMELLSSDQWKYFTGPKFKVKSTETNKTISVEKGIIRQSDFPGIVGKPFKDIFDKNPQELEPASLRRFISLLY
ncbi:putative lipoate--protein ligase NDAI_0G05900 [Naumovozyma dairenensis CBS 421]|uniref:Putative lipoate-protein ligase A n=1 Tax=Naumovozyma dairenensis (strain ATCC 10597 / BCRC 20456 / CBS 421 / NBRC 0211 / NRRL Y-12639) TaxID=1071378 RepID=J7SB59_NAUDC|nr:hypothetical protein NDAI_0G05900 [Naumovozyma dairenensis CBS 421]CCK73573.1 hypothetical protein NDAI_0G05900 [Naumovozyma dairenensis CBS 421]